MVWAILTGWLTELGFHHAWFNSVFWVPLRLLSCWSYRYLIFTIFWVKFFILLFGELSLVELPGWLTIVLQCYDTVAWIIWLIKSSLEWPIMCQVARHVLLYLLILMLLLEMLSVRYRSCWLVQSLTGSKMVEISEDKKHMRTRDDPGKWSLSGVEPKSFSSLDASVPEFVPGQTFRVAATQFVAADTGPLQSSDKVSPAMDAPPGWRRCLSPWQPLPNLLILMMHQLLVMLATVVLTCSLSH